MSWFQKKEVWGAPPKRNWGFWIMVLGFIIVISLIWWIRPVMGW